LKPWELFEYVLDVLALVWECFYVLNLCLPFSYEREILVMIFSP
jgi:uncharacterized protein YhhL (DUF1145 family)